MGTGGNHRHRQAGPLPQLAQNLQTVHIRKAQIQNDEIRTVGGDHGHRFRPAAGLHGLIAVVVEHGGNKMRNAFLILYH